MSRTPNEVINALHRIAKISYGATIDEARDVSKTQREAADLLEQQAARIAELATDLERTRQDRNSAHVQARREIGKEYRDHNDALLSALAECRDAFPAPAAGSELEGHWLSAMANPEEVPAYVKACLECAKSSKE